MNQKLKINAKNLSFHQPFGCLVNETFHLPLKLIPKLRLFLALKNLPLLCYPKNFGQKGDPAV